MIAVWINHTNSPNPNATMKYLNTVTSITLSIISGGVMAQAQGNNGNNGPPSRAENILLKANPTPLDIATFWTPERRRSVVSRDILVDAETGVALVRQANGVMAPMRFNATSLSDSPSTDEPTKVSWHALFINTNNLLLVSKILMFVITFSYEESYQISFWWAYKGKIFVMNGQFLSIKIRFCTLRMRQLLRWFLLSTQSIQLGLLHWIQHVHLSVSLQMWVFLMYLNFLIFNNFHFEVTENDFNSSNDATASLKESRYISRIKSTNLEPYYQQSYTITYWNRWPSVHWLVRLQIWWANNIITICHILVWHRIWRPSTT